MRPLRIQASFDPFGFREEVSELDACIARTTEWQSELVTAKRAAKLLRPLRLQAVNQNPVVHSFGEYRGRESENRPLGAGSGSQHSAGIPQNCGFVSPQYAAGECWGRGCRRRERDSKREFQASASKVRSALPSTIIAAALRGLDSLGGSRPAPAGPSHISPTQS